MYIINAILYYWYDEAIETVSRLRFAVNWVGYAEDEVSVVPWKDIKNNVLIIKYLKRFQDLKQWIRKVPHHTEEDLIDDQPAECDTSVSECNTADEDSN
jgi:hypothetical protein